MTSIHDLKLGSNTLEVLEVILNSLEAFPDEIAKLDLSKFTQIASSIDSSYQNIQTAGANITAMKNAINQTKSLIDEIKSQIDSKLNGFEADFASVNNIQSVITQDKNTIEAIKRQIDLIKSNFDSSFADFNAKNSEFNAKNSEFTQKSKSIKEYIDSKNSQIQNSIAINQELFKSLDENLAKNELIDRQVDIKMANLASKANEAIDDINSIKLDILNKVSNAKDDLDRSVLIADMAGATLSSYNAKSYEILEKFESDEIVEATYLLKGEIIHANAKLSANRLSLAIKQGATMAYRIKYELELPSLAELKDEYRSSNELAKDRLDKLDLMLNEADIMIRNSQFYNYLGVMI